jgi:hypothetical protein
MTREGGCWWQAVVPAAPRRPAPHAGRPVGRADGGQAFALWGDWRGGHTLVERVMGGGPWEERWGRAMA